jgi:hypothetical protein
MKNDAKNRTYSKLEVTTLLLKFLSDANEARYNEMDPFDKAYFISDWLDKNNLKEL